MDEQERKKLIESYGGKAVGLSFNPSKLIAVEVIKTDLAEVINDLHQTRTDATDPEVKRMLSIAITEIQTAQMWAVKALTWGK